MKLGSKIWVLEQNKEDAPEVVSDFVHRVRMSITVGEKVEFHEDAVDVHS